MENDLNDISKCPFHNGTMKKQSVAGGGTKIWIGGRIS
jgi:catalase-peroxidase